ncbi:MAG TPA: hypothetical protein VN260_00325 [Dissulfurispiraceae bacterium]|nr:hypothetical protein [Dissulfurispiraceae bacterium]
MEKETLTLSLHMNGGAKRLKALLKATMSIIMFVFQESTLHAIDHWLEPLSVVTVQVSPHQGFRRIRPTISDVLLQR